MKRIVSLGCSSLLLLTVLVSFSSRLITAGASNILYANDFEIDKGYIDEDYCWERNNNWTMTGGGGASNAAQSYYISNTNDVFVSDGELILRESANYHYVETVAVLPDLSMMEGWDNNYILTVKARFIDWNSNYSNELATTGLNILTRLNLSTSGNMFFTITPPKSTATDSFLNIFGRKSSGAQGQISGSYYKTNIGDVDLTESTTIRITLNGQAESTRMDVEAYDQTLSCYNGDGHGTLYTYFKNQANGNRIALSCASSSVAFDYIKVTSIDTLTTFYEHDFENGSHHSFWDGWSTYGFNATGSTEGYFYTKDGELHLDSKQNNYESFKNQILFIPGEYENFRMECDFKMKSSFEPTDGVFDKYLGFVFSGKNDGLHGGKYGTIVVRKNGKIDLLSHVSSEARSFITIQNGIRTANVNPIVYLETYHIVLSVIDEEISFTLSKDNTTQVSYTSSFKGLKTSPLHFKKGKIGFLANSTNFSVDNLYIYSE